MVELGTPSQIFKTRSPNSLLSAIPVPPNIPMKRVALTGEITSPINIGGLPVCQALPMPMEECSNVSPEIKN